MPARRKLPSDAQLKTWVEDNKSHEEIRIMSEDLAGEQISLSSVSSAMSRAGLTYRVRYQETYIPWPRIALDHNWAYQLQMLRLASRLERGLDVKPLEKGRLDNWIESMKLQDVVVMYEYNSVDGFYYVPRRAGKDLGLIREIEVPVDRDVTV